MSGPAEARVRAFFAVVPAETTRAALLQQVAELRRQPWSQAVRWVAGPNLHLTLRFLGDVERATAAALLEGVRERVGGVSAFDAAITRLELFPSRRAPRIVAAAVEGGERLLALAAAVEVAVREQGLEPEPRPFRGHITLGRVRGRLSRPPRYELPRVDAVLRVESVVLQQSVLAPQGAIYSELGRVELPAAVD